MRCNKRITIDNTGGLAETYCILEVDKTDAKGVLYHEGQCKPPWFTRHRIAQTEAGPVIEPDVTKGHVPE